MSRPTTLAPVVHTLKGMRRVRGIVRYENGLIAVEQCTVNGWTITYNPDDNRFWATDGDDIMGHTFKADEKGMNNATYWCKTHSATTGNTAALQGRPEGNYNPGRAVTDADVVAELITSLRMRGRYRLASAIEEHKKLLVE